MLNTSAPGKGLRYHHRREEFVMHLILSGRCLGVKSEERQGPRGPFQSVEFVVQSGEGIDTTVDRLSAGFDLKATDYPREGEDVQLLVRPRQFSRKDGTSGIAWDVTGNLRAKAGARIASAS